MRKKCEHLIRFIFFIMILKKYESGLVVHEKRLEIICFIIQIQFRFGIAIQQQEKINRVVPNKTYLRIQFVISE